MDKPMTRRQEILILQLDEEHGLRSDIQAIIEKYTKDAARESGSKDAGIRRSQAKRLWDLGVGRELGFKRFKDYLASTPEIPEALLKDDAEFPLLVLVQPFSLSRLCALGNIDFDGNDDTFIAYDARCAEFTQPTWIRVQDGCKNRNRKVVDCRTGFVSYEIGLTALQGVCAYLHHPTVISELNDNPDGHAMDLPGSVHRSGRGFAAYLRLWKGRVRLCWLWDDDVVPGYGSASRRECKTSTP